MSSAAGIGTLAFDLERPPPPRLEAWRDYAAGTVGPHFSWWASTYCVQTKDRWAGLPLELEPFQDAWWNEALATDDEDLFVWRVLVLVLPRKNGKTQMLAAYALYRLEHDDGDPEILLAASSDKQAGRLFDAAVAMVRASPYLSSRFVIREHVGEIVRIDRDPEDPNRTREAGLIVRMASRATTAHGYGPSVVVCDEVAQWTTPSLRKLWAALLTGSGARTAPQIFTITTAGEAEDREGGILGGIIDGAEAVGELERVGALRIARDHASRRIVWNYEAAPARDTDPTPLRRVHALLERARRDGDSERVAELEVEYRAAAERLVRAAITANPASWITADSLLEAALSTDLEAAQFQSLHCGVWASGREAYIPLDVWRAGAEPEIVERVLEDGVAVAVGADGSRTYDCTAVAWARAFDLETVDENGETRTVRACAVRCHVFAARADAPHHELCPEGRIDYDRVEQFTSELLERFVVDEAAYDPRYLDRSMEAVTAHLGETYAVPVEPTSRPYREAITLLRRLAFEARLLHDGDEIVGAHVGAAVGRESELGWQVYKRRVARPIDAVPAIALAVYRAMQPSRVGGWFEVWTR